MGIVLVESERCAGSICPGRAVVIISLEIAFIYIENIASAKCWSFSAGTVIRHEEDERIVKDATFFEGADQFANILINAINHCGIDSHAQIQFVNLIRFYTAPGRYLCIARRQLVFFIK